MAVLAAPILIYGGGALLTLATYFGVEESVRHFQGESETPQDPHPSPHEGARIPLSLLFPGPSWVYALLKGGTRPAANDKPMSIVKSDVGIPPTPLQGPALPITLTTPLSSPGIKKGTAGFLPTLISAPNTGFGTVRDSMTFKTPPTTKTDSPSLVHLMSAERADDRPAARLTDTDLPLASSLPRVTPQSYQSREPPIPSSRLSDDELTKVLIGTDELIVGDLKILDAYFRDNHIDDRSGVKDEVLIRSLNDDLVRTRIARNVYENLIQRFGEINLESAKQREAAKALYPIYAQLNINMTHRALAYLAMRAREGVAPEELASEIAKMAEKITEKNPGWKIDAWYETTDKSSVLAFGRVGGQILRIDTGVLYRSSGQNIPLRLPFVWPNPYLYTPISTVR